MSEPIAKIDVIDAKPAANGGAGVGAPVAAVPVAPVATAPAKSATSTVSATLPSAAAISNSVAAGKADPFKPSQPVIPGVPIAAQRAGAHPLSTRMVLVIVGGAFAVIVVATLVVFQMVREAGSKAETAVVAAAAPAVVADAGPNVDAIPVGPGPIGTTEELSKSWSAKRFDFVNPTTHEVSQAEVVRLPNGSYWGFSLTEPFGSCRLEYVQDLARLRDFYGFKAEHPMVADPCTHAVFDLMKYGPGIDGLVRGEIAQGSGLRPPLAIEIKVQDHRIIAARAE